MRNNLDHGLLHAVQILTRVVDAGSFTAAAEQLDLTTALVSRTVSLLERRLQTKLLQRTTRKLVLTEAGKRYVLQCRHILQLVAESEEDASEITSGPVGHLRILCMANFGKRYVVPLITEFVERYPKVSVEYITSQYTPDLIGHGVDVGIYISRQLPDSNQIVQKLGVVYALLCVAPSYVARNGMPLHPQDLSKHSCLRLNNPSAPRQWDLLNGTETCNVELTGPITGDSPDVLIDAAIRGVGIILLPPFTFIDALQEGKLLPCLPEWRTLDFNVFALIPS
ncbi:LysR family transcriptional regulator [Granulicella sp. dw_53]|uniref:LysR family transcriptional regulator n=1 Tax=Granulicella sp. dw_53 TaxID=2719792 RepID=UPI001BD33CB6|nr:LysR family transcriptional regulator [Granulicella sp. dw_53]